MKIGIWLPRGYSSKAGGGFSYLERLVEQIDLFNFNSSLDIVFISEEGETFSLTKSIIKLANPKQHPVMLFLGGLFKLGSFLPFIGKSLEQWIRKNLYEPYKSYLFKRTLENNKVKILFYPIQKRSEVIDFPFISTHWDTGHMTTYTFPEMQYKNAFKGREYFLRSELPKALLIFTESDTGKKELIDLTGIHTNRIKVLPLFPGSVTSMNVSKEKQNEILLKFKLSSKKYFFYPAQFWAHKNHYTLLRAFEQLLKRSSSISLVFTGSDKGNLLYIKNIVNQLKLTQNVHFLGFVTSEELFTLYRHTIALIMPTFLGPTNMPLLEARELKCPVLCSNLMGHKEIMGNGALYFNPSSEEDLLRVMKKILHDEERENLLNWAEEERLSSKFNINNIGSKLEKYFLEAAHIRSCWE